EALDDRRVVVRRARERRELDRIVVEDRRPDQRRFDEVRVRVVDQLRPRRILRDVDATLLETAAQVVLVACPETMLLERLDEAQPPPRWCEIDLLIAERHAGRSDNLPRGLRDELLDPLHRVP